MSFNPDKSNFKTDIDKLLHDMKSSVEDIQPINLHSDLQQFINGLITDTAPRFSIIVENSYDYKMTKKAIDQHLNDDFCTIEREVNKFEKCREIYQFQEFNFKDLQNDPDSESHDFIKDTFDKWNGWESQVNKHIQQQTKSGLILADAKKLKDDLQTKVKTELQNLRAHLNTIAENIGKAI